MQKEILIMHAFFSELQQWKTRSSFRIIYDITMFRKLLREIRDRECITGWYLHGGRNVHGASTYYGTDLAEEHPHHRAPPKPMADQPVEGSLLG
jgi:hypothetical protein